MKEKKWVWDETEDMLDEIDCDVISRWGYRDDPHKCQGLRIQTINGVKLVNKGDTIIKLMNGKFKVEEG